MQGGFLLPVFGLFLWHTPGSKGETLVVGPRKTIFALVEDDVTLPCSLQPPLNALRLTVEWTRPDLQPQYVHVFRDGRDEYDMKNPSYTQRTSLFLDELRNGNVSLRLSRVKLTDEGKYICFLPSLKSQVNNSATVELKVGAISQPKIFTVESKAGGVVLRCEAKSWFPQPGMEWREKEGRVLAADHTSTVKDPDGRYTVTSHVTVLQTTSNWFVCRVTLETLNQTREEETHILAAQFIQEGPTGRTDWALIGTVIGAAVLVIVAIAFAVVVLVRYLERNPPQSPAPAVQGGTQPGSDPEKTIGQPETIKPEEFDEYGEIEEIGDPEKTIDEAVLRSALMLNYLKSSSFYSVPDSGKGTAQQSGLSTPLSRYPDDTDDTDND